MNELITITEQDGRQAVSARELHQFLESKQEFANWVKNRIEKYGFVEGQDFEVFDNFIKNPQGGRPLTEYAISVDMAKELCMIENNEKGRVARKYFIECERRARNPFGVPTSLKDALLLAASNRRRLRSFRGRKPRTHRVSSSVRPWKHPTRASSSVSSPRFSNRTAWTSARKGCSNGCATTITCAATANATTNLRKRLWTWDFSR